MKHKHAELIKELAEQAGIGKDFAISGLWLAYEEELERFAELVRQDEREACAKVCDELANNQTNQSLLDPSDCAEATRQRGEQP
jgi:hypothetical protein